MCFVSTLSARGKFQWKHTDRNCEVGDVLLFSCACPTRRRSNPKHQRLLHTRPPGDAWKCCEKNGIGAAVFALRQSLAAHGHEWAVRKKRIIDERDADERQRDREERIIEVARGAATERVGMQQQATLPGRQRGGDYGHVVYYFPLPPSSLPAGVMQVASQEFTWADPLTFNGTSGSVGVAQ